MTPRVAVASPYLTVLPPLPIDNLYRVHCPCPLSGETITGLLNLAQLLNFAREFLKLCLPFVDPAQLSCVDQTARPYLPPLTSLLFLPLALGFLVDNQIGRVLHCLLRFRICRSLLPLVVSLFWTEDIP